MRADTEPDPDTDHGDTDPVHRGGPARQRRIRRAVATTAAIALLVPAALLLSAYGADANAPSHNGGHGGHGQEMDPREQASAMVATASYQDVEAAEAAGWASTIDTLGCFQNPTSGGMGVHYLNGSLMDATVDITKPEALVYELGRDGKPIGLVAHEYIVPVDAWTSRRPPKLFGMNFHRHPTLPLWVLHAWLWKDNPTGMFEDWNPAVRQCPAGVPIFGQDLPKA